MSEEKTTYTVNSVKIESIGSCISIDQIVQVLRDDLVSRRRSLLDDLDRLERLLDIKPRTAEIRRLYKSALIELSRKTTPPVSSAT